MLVTSLSLVESKPHCEIVATVFTPPGTASNAARMFGLIRSSESNGAYLELIKLVDPQSLSTGQFVTADGTSEFLRTCVTPAGMKAGRPATSRYPRGALESKEGFCKRLKYQPERDFI